MTNEQLYKLSCPSCGNVDLLMRDDDIEGNEFIGDPEATCAQCGRVFRLSESSRVMCSEGQILHMARGGDAT
jgi:predicted RNA-binding Zn-ribbon protein involved in translation (DUF1610 family)